VAKESYRTGDLPKTNAILLELSGTENGYTAPARVWQLVVSAGLTQGFSELADAYESGSQRDVANPLRFRNQAANLRSLAATAALEFTQAVHDTAGATKDAKVQFAFGFPPGSAVPPEGLLKISGGMWPRVSDRESVQAAMLQRGVLRVVSTAVGSPEDPVKALAVFQTADVRIPRETFLYGVAKLLYEESDLFGARRIDRPDRLMLMCREAIQALQSIPGTEDTRALAADIQDRLKKYSGV
jgi:hypothetical protein